MLAAGDKVLVHSLEGRADLNGAVVTLKEWVEDKGRWSLVVTGHCEGTASKAAFGERVLVRPENLSAMSPGQELVAAVHSAIKAVDVEAVLSRFVEGVVWPQDVATELMAAAWATDERRGCVGAYMKYGGVVSALFMGMTQCQAKLGIEQLEGLSERAGVDNASMLLFSFAIDTDNVKALALVYEWSPNFLLSRGPLEEGIEPSAEAIAALSLDDDDDPLLIDYAYELAEGNGATACFEFLCKRNATAKKVHQARRAAQREAGIEPSRPVSCAWCGDEADKSLMKRCQQCRVVWYCGRECQKAAWQTHKASCEPPREEVKGACIMQVKTPWGTSRISQIFDYKGKVTGDDAATYGRPRPNSSDPTRKCFLLQLRVRAPGGGNWLSAPRPGREKADTEYAVDVRQKVSNALVQRGYRQLEGCLLNAAFYDDGSGESRFVRVATECATTEGTEVKLAALCVDPGLGLFIKHDEVFGDDHAWEMPGDDLDPSEVTEKARRADEKRLAAEKKASRRGKNKGKNKDINKSRP